METQVIGTYTLPFTEDFRQGYETASWYTLIRCETQTVEIRAEVRNGKVVDDRMGWVYSGTVVDTNFPSSFGGVSYGGGKRPEDHGKPASFHVSPYAHSLAHAILEGKGDPNLKLAHGWVALYSGYGDPTVDSHAGYSAGLYFNPTQAQRHESMGIRTVIHGNGCMPEGATVEFRKGYARALAAQARDLAGKAELNASSSRSVWREMTRAQAAEGGYYKVIVNGVERFTVKGDSPEEIRSEYLRSVGGYPVPEVTVLPVT